MNLYICGPYSHRAELLDRANELVDASNGRITITSSWLQGEHEANEGHASLEEMACWADDDMRDIRRSDVLVQCIERPSITGGAHCEFMYAATRIGMDTIICGNAINVFHAWEIAYCRAVHAPDWATARAWLLERAED